MVHDEEAGRFSPSKICLSKIGDARQDRPVRSAGTEARCSDERAPEGKNLSEEAKVLQESYEQPCGPTEARPIQGGGGGEKAGGTKGGGSGTKGGKDPLSKRAAKVG